MGCPGNMAQVGPLSSAHFMLCFLHCVIWLCTTHTLLGVLTLHTETAELYMGVFLSQTLSCPAQASPSPAFSTSPAFSPSQCRRIVPIELPSIGCFRTLNTHPTAPDPMKGTGAPGEQREVSAFPISPRAEGQPQHEETETSVSHGPLLLSLRDAY